MRSTGRVCVAKRGDGEDCHITDVIYHTQDSRNSRSVLENVYDVSKTRYGIEEAFLHAGSRSSSAQA